MRNLTISGFTTQRLLGEGGMSTVWYAENSLKRPAAIKFLKPELLIVPAVRQRFRDEAEALTRLSHPNIRAVLDFSQTDSYLAIVFEYLDGEDLSEWLESHGPAGRADAQKWTLQALSALQQAHSQGIVHRDIKPANLFLTRSGELKILDFGIAKIVGSEAGVTRTNLAIGSPMYMSPEQVLTPKEVDYRTDLYSLGVTLHALLTGRRPFDDETDSEFVILRKVVDEPLPPLPSTGPGNDATREALNAIIARATAKKRDDRYRDCAAFAADIQGVKVGSLPKASDLAPKKPKQDETLVEGIAVPTAKNDDEIRVDIGNEKPDNHANKELIPPKNSAETTENDARATPQKPKPADTTLVEGATPPPANKHGETPANQTGTVGSLPKTADRTTPKSQETQPNRKPLIIGGSVMGAIVLMMGIALNMDSNNQQQQENTGTNNAGFTPPAGNDQTGTSYTEPAQKPVTDEARNLTPIDRNKPSQKPSTDGKPNLTPLDREPADWSKASEANTVAAYATYLSRQPKGAHASQARKAQSGLQTKADELLKKARMLRNGGQAGLADDKEQEANRLLGR